MQTTIDTEASRFCENERRTDPFIGTSQTQPTPASTPPSTRAPARHRRRTALGVAALLTLAAMLVSSSPASAAVVSPTTGAIASSEAFCYGNMVSVTTSSTLFESRRVHVYVNGQWRNYGWQALGMYTPTAGQYFGGGAVWVYVEYADLLPGGRWEYFGEWVRMTNGDYSCLAW